MGGGRRQFSVTAKTIHSDTPVGSSNAAIDPTETSRTNTDRIMLSDDIGLACRITYDTVETALGTVLPFDDICVIGVVGVGQPCQLHGGMVDAVSIGIVRGAGMGWRVWGVDFVGGQRQLHSFVVCVLPIVECVSSSYPLRRFEHGLRFEI